MSKSVQKSGQKKTSTEVGKTKRKSRKEDWETNHILIKEAFTELLRMKRRAPTIVEIANRVGLSYKTVDRHIKELQFDPLASPSRLLTEDVLAGVTRSAIAGSPANARLFFQLLHGWIEPGKEKVDPRHDNDDNDDGPSDERRAAAVRDLLGRVGKESAGSIDQPGGNVDSEHRATAGGTTESGG